MNGTASTPEVCIFFKMLVYAKDLKRNLPDKHGRGRNLNRDAQLACALLQTLSCSQNGCD